VNREKGWLYAPSQKKFTSSTVLRLEGQALADEQATPAEGVEEPDADKHPADPGGMSAWLKVSDAELLTLHLARVHFKHPYASGWWGLMRQLYAHLPAYTQA